MIPRPVIPFSEYAIFHLIMMDSFHHRDTSCRACSAFALPYTIRLNATSVSQPLPQQRESCDTLFAAEVEYELLPPSILAVLEHHSLATIPLIDRIP